MEVRNLVRDFTNYRLRLGGYNNWGEEPVLSPSPIVKTVRLLALHFERKYEDRFEEMTATIDLLDHWSREAIEGVSKGLFEDGIRWGRIMGLIVFSARLSLNAMERDLPDRVDDIVEWTSDYLLSDFFRNWILTHGGWVSNQVVLKN